MRDTTSVMVDTSRQSCCGLISMPEAELSASDIVPMVHALAIPEVKVEGHKG